MEETSDIELIKRYCKGEVDAFDELYDKYVRLVSYICKKILGNSTYTEDLTQDVFVKVLENIFVYYQNNPNMIFKAWVITIARNTCYTFSNRRGKEKDVVKVALEKENIGKRQVDAPDGAALENESNAALLEIIDQLDDNEKTIVKNFIHGIPVKETADMLGISQRHVHRLFGQTKDVMEKELRKRGL